MRNSKKYKRLFVLLLIFIFTTSGCSLAPKEEVLPDAPILPTGTVEQYKKVSVVRGDIINTVTIDCTYKSFKTEVLKFSEDGKEYGHVYFGVGDPVHAGDVVADLDMPNIDQQIADRTDSIELINKKIANENELMDLAIATQNKLKGMEGYNSQLDDQYTSEIQNHEDTINGLKDDLHFEQERLDSLNTDVKKNQLIAGIDGVVLSVANHDFWERTSKDKSFMTIYDPNAMVFVTDGSNPELFKPGQEVTITVKDTEYKAVVLDPKEISQYVTDQNTGAVYLKVDNQYGLLQNDDKGEITFTLNEVKDVLYLPQSAVYKEKDKTIVYVEDEGGFKSIKEVTTGITGDRKVEITSGLKDGDNVIIN